MQKLYRRNRKKALRIIYDEDSDVCNLDPQAVADHYSSNRTDPSDEAAFFDKMPKAKLFVNTQYFTKKEVRLKACDNTATGPDGLAYNHLKLVDPVTAPWH